jgi:hypothetical protein
VEAGGTTLAASALLGLVRPSFVLLRRLHELTEAPLSHPVGLTRPVEMPASADAEDQRNEGELPQA